MALCKLSFIISQNGRKLELPDNFLWKSPKLNFNMICEKVHGTGKSPFMALHKLGFIMVQYGRKSELPNKF
jgi:hypothetical protein